MEFALQGAILVVGFLPWSREIPTITRGAGVTFPLVLVLVFCFDFFGLVSVLFVLYVVT